jgi:transposase
MELADELGALFIDVARAFKGSDRRIFMARVVEILGKGGQRRAERELNWNRGTIRKGNHELESGFTCEDAVSARGRKPAEEHLPNLLDDIKDIADAQSQADPSFKTTRLYTRLSAAEVRRQLNLQKGYSDEELPSEETIRVKLNQMGYELKSVQKSLPEKKIPETDAIFEQLDKVHAAADEDETVLRMSMDAKATVLIGLFSRNGKTRVFVKAMDHDFAPDEKLTPYGIFLPQYNELYLYFTTSRITSDFIVDCLCDFWLTVRERFPKVQTLLLNQDNGPENHSRRTQFMKRITEFADEFQMTIQLAYYPPYHSKYNSIERVWGVLENHWNGSLLDTIETVLNYAQTMTWNGHHPVVKLVEKTYPTGIRLTQKEMARLEEERFERLPGLGKWFVRISPAPQHLLE